MHPAPSIIAFTVLSGLGYGLAFILGLQLLHAHDLATKAAFLLAFALISAGLLASTFHLGNSQRAWRAFSQWRSSWLSREGVMSVLTFIPLVWTATAVLFIGRYESLGPFGPYANGYPIIACILLMIGAAITVFCTSMIYAQLKSVDAWHTWLTPCCYLAFALTGGLLIAALAAFLSHNPVAGELVSAAFLANLAAWGLKCVWRLRMKRHLPTSTTASATQLGKNGAVRQFEPPHITGNYLTHEMMFKVGRKHGNALFAIALFFGVGLLLVLLPLAWMACSNQAWGAGALLMTLALACHLAGVLTERWLFFAEARHAVSSFYGE